MTNPTPAPPDDLTDLEQANRESSQGGVSLLSTAQVQARITELREVRREREAATQRAERLEEALENLAIHGVTAGANPQRDGTMSPPLWHMECRLCGARWSKQQKKQPREHPPHTSRFSPTCPLTPPADTAKETQA